MEEFAPKLFNVTTKLMENRQKLQTYANDQKPIHLKDDEPYDIPLDFVRNICKVVIFFNKTLKNNKKWRFLFNKYYKK